MREEFEKLPEIADLIYQFDFSEETNTYHIRYDDMDISQKRLDVMYLGGAWYAYQEQQKKIDAVIKTVDWHIEDCGIVEETEYNKAWYEAMLFVKQELLK